MYNEIGQRQPRVYTRQAATTFVPQNRVILATAFGVVSGALMTAAIAMQVTDQRVMQADREAMTALASMAAACSAQPIPSRLRDGPIFARPLQPQIIDAWVRRGYP